MAKDWSKNEDLLLEKNCSNMNDRELSILLNRTLKSVKHRRIKLGLKNNWNCQSSQLPWSKEEDQILIDNYRKIPYKEIIKLLPNKRTVGSLENRRTYLIGLIKNPILRKSSNDVWTPEEDEIIIKNYGKLTYEQMLELLPNKNRTVLALQSRKSQLEPEADLTTLRRNQRKHFYNNAFFEIPNIVNCYFAGLLSADGNISKNRENLAITLHQKDKPILETFSKCIEYTGEVVDRYYEKQNKLTSRLLINGCGRDLIPDLEKHFNIVPKKSLILKPPNLKNEELIKSFIKGYIDGDGHINMDSKGNGQYAWIISVCGTKEMLEWIKFYFDKWAPNAYHNKFSKVRKYDYNRIHHYSVNGNRSIEILKQLCGIHSPYLERKWRPFMHEHNCYYKFTS